MKRLLPVLLSGAALASAAVEAPPQWPPAPERARVRFVTLIEGPRAAGAGRIGGFIRKLIGLGGPGEVAADRLVRPTGLFVSSGTVYIADPGARRVLRYRESDGKGVWLPPSPRDRLVSPVGVGAAPDGRLFVLDSALAKVFILSPEGRILGEFEGDPQGMGRPAALAVSPDMVFVSDVKNHRVSVYGIEGVFLHAFGRRGGGPGELNFPTYLWYERGEDRLWVVDSGNFRVQWFSPDGRPLGRIGSNGNRPGYLARPRGLARDSDGHVYLADAAFDAIQIFNEEERLLLFIGRAGGGPGEFAMPGGLFIDGRDRIYAADALNARVQVFQYLKEAKP